MGVWGEPPLKASIISTGYCKGCYQTSYYSKRSIAALLSGKKVLIGVYYTASVPGTFKNGTGNYAGFYVVGLDGFRVVPFTALHQIPYTAKPCHSTRWFDEISFAF